jgi:alkylhydroperoxidase family enzyme
LQRQHHFNVSRLEDVDKAELLSCYDEMNEVVYVVVVKLTGLASAEHSIGLLKRDPSCLAPDERALVDFVTEVVRIVSPSDTTMQNARTHFSDALLFEAVVILGYYMLTARVIGVGGVDLEEKPVTTW